MLHIVKFLQSLYSTTLYTEEFDFEAMNEKFKKDEVWGYLGKASQKDKAEGMEDDASDHSLGDKQGFGLLAKFDTQVFLLMLYIQGRFCYFHHF